MRRSERKTFGFPAPRPPRLAAVIIGGAVVLGAAGAAAAHPDRDVSVAIAGSERARQGDYVSYTATAASVGHEAVAGVTLRFSLPPDWTVRSMTWSRGSCTRRTATCRVGTLASGGRAVATILVWAPTARTATVAASVSATPPDANVANDAARVTTAVSRSRCRLALGSRRLQPGVRGTLTASVRLGANPVIGQRVVARGAGASASARTSVRGLARLSVRPSRAGVLAVRLPALASCRASVAVRGSERA